MLANGFLEPIVIEPIAEHSHTIILLHGRGSTGKEFSEELFESQASTRRTLPELLPGYRWIFPSAKTIFAKTFQEDMSQWYDIQSLSDPDANLELQLDGIRDSLAHVRELVSSEAAAAPTGRVILGGISQGFSVAVTLALVDSSQVHALVGFSSWLSFCSQIQANITSNTYDSKVTIRDAVSTNLKQTLRLRNLDFMEQPSIPVFLAHCIDDGVVDIEMGRKLYKTLVDLGHPTTWLESETGGHWINEPDAVDELVAFLSRNGLIDVT